MNTTIDDLLVMTSGAFTAAYLELIPRLELLTKKKLVTAATSIGTGETSIPNRLRRGDPVDVVIVADGVLSRIHQGRPGPSRKLYSGRALGHRHGGAGRSA